MSEAELHLLKMRMEEGRMRQVERGDLRQSLPTGLVRLPNGTVVKDPDDQVRHTIELVFAKFEELGSCRKVMNYLREKAILLPRRQTYGPQLSETVWKQAAHAGVYAFLRNPAYAGAFVFGKTYRDPIRQKPGRKDTGIVRRPVDAWPHIHQNIYPAYIPWERFLQNQGQLRKNAVRFDRAIQKAGGPPRRGEALLQGLVICGECGYHMNVEYNPFPRYLCKEMARRLGITACKSISGSAVDAVVVEQFFAAIQPAQLDALAALLNEQQAERDQLIRTWEERMKRARYETKPAERQYHAVDPDNRLVAAELERRWEEKLRQMQETQEAYDRFLQTPLAPQILPEMREQFRQISDSLPHLWQTGQITIEQKKELLRTLISHIIFRRTQTNSIEINIVWVSGHYSVVEALPPVYRASDLHNVDLMTERIRLLWQMGNKDDQIALQLTEEGFRSPRSLTVCPATVQRIRLQHNWKSEHPKISAQIQLEGYLSTTDLANQLGVHRSNIIRRIYNHAIPPSEVIRHPVFKTSYLIRSSPDLLECLKQDLSQNPCVYERI